MFSSMKPHTTSYYQAAVERTVQRILESLDEALDLGNLARQAAFSPFHFHRIFRGMVGETPLAMHRRLRMERAAWSLLHRDVSVTTVAFEAGYDTHEAFTRAFRKNYQCSPTEFRQRAALAHNCAQPWQVELTAPSGVHYQPGPDKPLYIHFIQGAIMQVDIKNMPEIRLATLRHVGPYHRISEAFSRLGPIAGKAGLLGPQAMMIALYHDDPESKPESELCSDAAVSIPEGTPVPEGLTEQRLSAGRYAVATHVGPYQQLGDAWARLMGQWLPQSGERLGEGVSYEVYRNNPQDTPQDKLLTELYVPLA